MNEQWIGSDRRGGGGHDGKYGCQGFDTCNSQTYPHNGNKRVEGDTEGNDLKGNGCNGNIDFSK
jgi:hypothetical protein